jgi:cytochrome c biogenesis protein CcmG, thiol:disulfide interchange protein DsbE
VTGSGRPGPATARRLTPPLALLLTACAAACTAEAGPAPHDGQPASPFADCSVLTSAPAARSSAGPAPSGPAVGSVPGAAVDLPDLELPCFTGGVPFRLTALRGPAVVNLWASWCEPCREELPAMQRLADSTAGRLHVVGVDTGDARGAAASFGADAKVTLPTLYDRDRKLVGLLGRVALPVTVFVDAAGKRFVYNQLPPDDAQLAQLVRDHTGVAVAP